MKRFKKVIAFALAAAMTVSMTSMPTFAASGSATDSYLKKTSVEKAFDGSFFSVTGFAKGKVNDRSNYKEGDAEYRVVKDEKEFLEALNDAKAGVVKVIELQSDMNLGWWELNEEAKAAGSGLIKAYEKIDSLDGTSYTNPTLIETGLSDLRINDVDGLTIFSQLGNTIRHAQFQLEENVNDFVMRNISINEVWEWDDFTSGNGFGSKGGKGTHKRVGWTPVKVNGSKNVWFDHCSFGLGFDGCLDLENGAEGISLTWCRVGDTDVTVGSMVYKTAMYMEQLYQESKEKNNENLAFTAYRIMRDNGMTVEDVMEYMAYHSKVHLCGAGDKDTWLVPITGENGELLFDYSDGMTYTKESLSNITSDLAKWMKENNLSEGSKFGTVKTQPDFDKTDANELIELTLAYNQYWNVGQRVPMIRGGVGHLINCYVNDAGTENSMDKVNTLKNGDGKSIAKQMSEAGSSVGKLARTINARNGASIAADTCVWQNVSQPVPGEQYQKSGLANMNAPYHAFFTYNYVGIVNSKVQRTAKSETYIGNNYDKNGKNEFSNIFNWKDASIPFSWHNLAIKNAYRAEGATSDAVTIAKYDKLTYDYQTFPLESVEEITTKYSGFGKVKMSAQDWLKTEYPSDFTVDPIDESDLHDATGVQLSVTSASVYLDEGEHLQLGAEILPANSKSKQGDLKWTSSDETVAKVSDCGLVTPLKYGETTITVALGDMTATCLVSVEPSPSEIQLMNVPDTLYTGDVFDLDVKITPENVKNKDVIWGSLSGSIELLDAEKGVFKAVKTGRNVGVNVTSLFTANRVGYQRKTLDYKKFKITDPAVPVTGINLDSSAVAEPMNVGDEATLAAAVVPADATNQKIYWSSSDVNVATVDENGKVTAVSGGSAVIEAKSMNYGFVATCAAVVSAPVNDFVLGDANGDGVVDLKDATFALRVALGIETMEDVRPADVDFNGKVELSDCVTILKAALGIVKLEKAAVASMLGL